MIPALILAAGRGERLRPLTDATPKPLLQVQGKALIVWQLEALARAGVKRVVINTAWLEEQFPATLGDGAHFGLRIDYSMEGRDHGGALETAGGIAKALPLLGEHFWVVSGDVFVPNFQFKRTAVEAFIGSNLLAQLWLAPNAPHHPSGDFAIDAQGLAVSAAAPAHGLRPAQTGVGPRRTWASLGLFRAELFAGIKVGTRLPLRPLLDHAMAARRLGAQAWDGGWTDVGNAERLAQADLMAPVALRTADPPEPD